MPVEGVITSVFGERINPISDKSEIHNGIDIGVDEGTEVKACISGTVSETGENEGYGKYIKFSNGEYEILYAHLSDVLKSEGDSVEMGETVALSSNTGYSTGPHLHFTVFKNGSETDPLTEGDFE